MGIFDFFLKEEYKKKSKSVYDFSLQSENGRIDFYNPFLNFLIYGGMGCGKTKSIAKPLLAQYLKNNFAGLVYDLKDFDFTKTVFNLLLQPEFKDYPFPFYNISFPDARYSSRTNPISPATITDETLFVQLIDDMLKSYVVRGGGKLDNDIWLNGALGIFQGVAYRIYLDFPQYCTIPHIVLFCTQSNAKIISSFLEANPKSRGLASAFITAKDSPKTQASYLSTLTNYLSSLAFSEEIIYILSGNDFEFNLIDPMNPKLVCISNSFQKESIISPIVSLMLGVSTRQFTMTNTVPFFYMLDEATTFKIPNFQNMISVLREYKCSFSFITQSSSKIEHIYSKMEKSIIEANFGNHFYGRTRDVEAIKSYPIIFGQSEKERVSRTKGGYGERKSSSRTVSYQKENLYDPDFFTKLQPGQFVCSFSESNKNKLVTRFKMFDYEEVKPLPIIHPVSKKDISDNYGKIIKQIAAISLC